MTSSSEKENFVIFQVEDHDRLHVDNLTTQLIAEKENFNNQRSKLALERDRQLQDLDAEFKNYLTIYNEQKLQIQLKFEADVKKFAVSSTFQSDLNTITNHVPVCEFGKHCSNRESCKNWHSDIEKYYFKLKKECALDYRFYSQNQTRFSNEMNRVTQLIQFPKELMSIVQEFCYTRDFNSMWLNELKYIPSEPYDVFRGFVTIGYDKIRKFSVMTKGHELIECRHCRSAIVDFQDACIFWWAGKPANNQIATAKCFLYHSECINNSHCLPQKTTRKDFGISSGSFLRIDQKYVAVQ